MFAWNPGPRNVVYDRAVRSAALLVACVTLGAAAPARADDAGDALDLARQGETAAANGDLPGAVALFKRALALDPRPEYQCNVGVAYYKGGDLPRAQLFLSLCLARGSHLDAGFLDGVRGVLVAVEDTLRAGEFTPVDVVVSPPSAEFTVSAFGADEAVIGGRLVWLPSGDHTIVVTASGHVTQTVPVSATGHDLVRVPVTLEELPVADPVPVIIPAHTEVDRRRGWRTAALVGTGVTGVAALLTIGQYVRAWGATTDAGELPPGAAYTEAAATAQDQIDLLNVAYGVTAGCAVVTAVLWWQSRPREYTVAATPTGDGATVSIAGRF